MGDPWPFGTILELPVGPHWTPVRAMHIGMDFMLCRALMLTGPDRGQEQMIAPEEWRIDMIARIADFVDVSRTELGF
jgi:hypothetical protein